MGKSGSDWTKANVGLPAIFIGNHFTLDDLELVYASEQARRLDKTLIALDRLYWVQSQEPHIKLAHFSQGNPRLEFKFGSSFEGILKVTDERLDGVKIYRSIIIDILIYTQKLLADFSTEIEFGNIRMDDLNVLIKWRKGPSSILLWIGVLHHTKGIVDHIFKSRNLNIFSKSDLATIFLEYELYWLEYYYPREFYSVVTFLAASYLPAQLDSVTNLIKSLISRETLPKLYAPLEPGNGFLYPGCRVSFRTPKD